MIKLTTGELADDDENRAVYRSRDKSKQGRKTESTAVEK